MKFEQKTSTAVAKTGASKEVIKKTATIPASKKSIVVLESEGDSSDEKEEDENTQLSKKKNYRRGIRGSKPRKRRKPQYNIEEDIAERAAYMIDKSLEEQALMYELFEAKKKEHAQKVKVNKYFMKYGKSY